MSVKRLKKHSVVLSVQNESQDTTLVVSDDKSDAVIETGNDVQKSMSDIFSEFTTEEISSAGFELRSDGTLVRKNK